MNGYRKVEKEGKMKKELIELLKKYKFKVFIKPLEEKKVENFFLNKNKKIFRENN